MGRTAGLALHEQVDSEFIQQFRDTGCYLSRTCLGCQIPVCKEDDPLAARTYSRDIEIRRLNGEGITIRETARRVGVSERTVYRVLRG